MPYRPGEFPGGLVVRTWHFYCHGPDSIPGHGTVLIKKQIVLNVGQPSKGKKTSKRLTDQRVTAARI